MNSVIYCVTSHTNEAWHVWQSHGILWHRNIMMCHVAHQRVMSIMNHSYHVGMSHVNINEWWHIWWSHLTYEWKIAWMNTVHHAWIVRFTYERIASYMNGLCTAVDKLHSTAYESWHIWICLISVVSHWAMAHINSTCHMWLSHGT